MNLLIEPKKKQQHTRFIPSCLLNFALERSVGKESTWNAAKQRHHAYTTFTKSIGLSSSAVIRDTLFIRIIHRKVIKCLWMLFMCLLFFFNCY